MSVEGAEVCRGATPGGVGVVCGDKSLAQCRALLFCDNLRMCCFNYWKVFMVRETAVR